MKLSSDLKEFIELLNSHKVEYIIVGAHALAWHGLPRYTKNIDLLIRPTKENSEALETVIHDFGFGSTSLQAADFIQPDQIIQLGMEPNRIDLLTGISGSILGRGMERPGCRGTRWHSGFLPGTEFLSQK